MLVASGCAGRSGLAAGEPQRRATLGSPTPTPSPCPSSAPMCHIRRLPNVTVRGNQRWGALGPVDGFDVSGIISFDEALNRAWIEDEQGDADTVQVVLGSSDAWGKKKLYYAIDWEGICYRGSRPHRVSSSPGVYP